MSRSSLLLIALKGHPGAGKSAVARAIGRHLAIPVIDKDDIKDVLAPVCSDAGGLAYTAMFNIARQQLRLGLSVICDSPLSEQNGYAAACSIARETAAQPAIVECVCSSAEEWCRRIEQRAAQGQPTHHIATWSDLEQHVRVRGPSSTYPIDAPHIVVDTVQPLEDVLAQILEWLEHLSRVSPDSGTL